jgi:hypothetical protein
MAQMGWAHEYQYCEFVFLVVDFYDTLTKLFVFCCSSGWYLEVDYGARHRLDTCFCIYFDSDCDSYFSGVLFSADDGVDVGSEIIGGYYCTITAK